MSIKINEFKKKIEEADLIKIGGNISTMIVFDVYGDFLCKDINNKEYIWVKEDFLKATKQNGSYLMPMGLNDKKIEIELFSTMKIYV